MTLIATDLTPLEAYRLSAQQKHALADRFLRRLQTIQHARRPRSEVEAALRESAADWQRQGLDTEAALRRANEKFTRRFTAVEKTLAAKGQTPTEAGLALMEATWQHVKAAAP